MPHIHPDIDFTVSAAIVFDRRVLLVDHPRYAVWLTPGGHVELNEDTDQALLREIHEETGMGVSDIEVISERGGVSNGDGKPLWVPRWMNIHPANPPHRHIDLMYLIRAKSDRIILDRAEHNDIRWFADKELEDASITMFPDTRWYAREAIKLLS
ncbi:NUDIX domain-containing protein [Candidatus Parcubacteria bacterium]|nr:MAG: NUDIX domain-containing protein [Candidatus Parcubacteria bacterium]